MAQLFLTTTRIKTPNRKHGNLPGSSPLKGVIRELTGCTCNTINGSTCEGDLASTGNLDRAENSTEIQAAGAQPDPGARSVPREQEEGPGLDSAGDTSFLRGAHYTLC